MCFSKSWSLRTAGRVLGYKSINIFQMADCEWCLTTPSLTFMEFDSPADILWSPKTVGRVLHHWLTRKELRPDMRRLDKMNLVGLGLVLPHEK